MGKSGVGVEGKVWVYCKRFRSGVWLRGDRYGFGFFGIWVMWQGKAGGLGIGGRGVGGWKRRFSF